MLLLLVLKELNSKTLLLVRVSKQEKISMEVERLILLILPLEILILSLELRKVLLRLKRTGSKVHIASYGLDSESWEPPLPFY